MKNFKTALSTMLLFVFLSVNVSAGSASPTESVYTFFSDLFEKVEEIIYDDESLNGDPDPDEDDCDIRTCTNCTPGYPNCRP